MISFILGGVILVFSRLILFGFAPEALVSIRGEPGTPTGLPLKLHQKMLAEEKLRGPASRILAEPEGLLPVVEESRVIDSSSSGTRAEREDDKQWSNMNRAL